MPETKLKTKYLFLTNHNTTISYEIRCHLVKISMLQGLQQINQIKITLILFPLIFEDILHTLKLANGKKIRCIDFWCVILIFP